MAEREGHVEQVGLEPHNVIVRRIAEVPAAVGLGVARRHALHVEASKPAAQRDAEVGTSGIHSDRHDGREP